MSLTETLTSEEKRLADLYSLEILDSENEKEFDEITQLASDIAGVPVSLISLIDRDRQWFKSKKGWDVAETSRDVSFCSHAIASGKNAFIVEDATADNRFATNELVVNDPSIKFYAGFPLTTSQGNKIGTLCVIDKVPRALTQIQISSLTRLSRQAMKMIELRLSNKKLQQLMVVEARQKALLEKLVANQRKMTTILAHDTRGPLSAMKELLRLLVEKKLPVSDTEKLHTMMIEQLDVTMDMIENLVNWGEVHLKYEEQGCSAQKLQQSIEQVMRQCSLSAHAKNNKLTLSLADSSHLGANDEMISFIIRNLLNNAIKYTEDGEISITGQKKDDHYELLVNDTGVGMNEVTLRGLFSGKTSSKSGTRNEKGTGLGLMLIRDFVDASGGSIEVESKIGKGTQIVIRLPFHQS